MRSPLLLIIGTFAVLVTFFVVGGYFQEKGPVAVTAPSGPSMLAGAPAVGYPVRRTDGSTDSLDRYRGHVVLLNLWATWCEPCREEMPALEQLYERDRARGLVVLGVDQGESAETVRSFARKIGVRYPLLLDEEQKYGRAYAALGLPTSVIVDRRGHIVRGIDGQLTLAQMRQAIEPLL